MAQSASLPSQIENLRQICSLAETFTAFDADNDGYITAAELGGILASLGNTASEEDVRAMMEEGDKNKDGLLSVKEFLEMNSKDIEIGELADGLKACFEALDVDGDEVVTAEEIYQVMGSIGMGVSLEECGEIVSSMDGDGDGVVTVEDYKLIVESLL